MADQVPLETASRRVVLRGPRRAAASLLVGLALAVASSMAGCGGGGDGGSDPTARRDSAGVTVVESRAPAWSDGRKWTVADTPAVEIGSGVGSGEDPMQQLSGVSGLVVLADGRFVAANGGDNSLRYYSSDGRYLRSAAGEGEGPGEIAGSRPGGLVLLAPDTLATVDQGEGTVELYSTAGEHVGRIRLDPTGDPVRPLRLYGLGGRLGDGSLLLLPNAFPANMRPEPTTYWDAVPNLVYGMDGTLRDTLARPSGMEMYATQKVAGNLPFGSTTSADVADGRLYKGRGEDFSVRVYGRGGLERIVRRSPFDRRRIDDSLRSRAPGPRTDMPIPERRPAYSGIAVGPDGHLWVEHHLRYRESGPATWSVFDPEGRWLGDVRVPVNLDNVTVTADGLAGVWRDPADVERVRLYPVERGR